MKIERKLNFSQKNCANMPIYLLKKLIYLYIPTYMYIISGCRGGFGVKKRYNE